MDRSTRSTVAAVIEVPRAPAVRTYGVPSGAGARASTFDVGELHVLVNGGSGEEGTEAAFALACCLASATLVQTEDRATIDRLERELAAAKARIPPARPARLMGRGYVRFTGAGELWVLGGREKGWGHFGYRCESWDDLFRRYNVRVVEAGEDEHGPWWAVENMGAAEPGKD